MTGLPRFGELVAEAALEESRQYDRRVGDELWTVWLRSKAGEIELAVAEVGGQVEVAKYPGLASWIEEMMERRPGADRLWHTSWRLAGGEVAREIERQLVADGAELALWIIRSSDPASLPKLVACLPPEAVARFRVEASRGELYFETTDRGESFELRLESPPPESLAGRFGAADEHGTHHAELGRLELEQLLAWLIEPATPVWAAWDFGAD